MHVVYTAHELYMLQQDSHLVSRTLLGNMRNAVPPVSELSALEVV